MMWTAAGLIWLCSHVGVACEASAPPNAQAVQAAYDREVSAGNPLHDKNLQVLEAKCTGPDGKGGFLCEVSYFSRADRSEQLYFDVVAMSGDGSNWKLTSGLCRR